MHLPAERLVELTVGNHRLDLQIELVKPDGLILAETWMKEWRWRPYSLMVLPEAAGSYEIRIHGLTAEPEACGEATGEKPATDETAVATGSYQIQLAVLRPATPLDQALAAASSEHAAGTTLAQCGPAEPRRTAMDHLHKAFEHLSAAEPPSDSVRASRAAAHFWIGLLHLDFKEFDAALSSLLEARELFRGLGDPGAEADTFYRLGETCRKRGEYREAMDWFHQALTLYRQLGESQPEAFTLLNLGFLNKELTRLYRALDLYLPALQLLRELGLSNWKLTALINIGSAYQLLGDFERARLYFDDALEESRELKRRSSEAAILNHIGSNERARGEIQSAKGYLENAVRLAREHSSPRRLANYLDQLGRTLVDLGRLEDARCSCREALELSLAAKDEVGQAKRHVSLARIHRAALQAPPPMEALCAETDRRRPEAAHTHLEKALALGQRLGERRIEAEARREQALLARDLGELEVAVERAGEAVAVVERVFEDIGESDLLAVYLGLQRSVYELYVDLLMSLAVARGDRALEADAFAVHERARARGTLRGLGHTESEVGVSPLEIERRTELEQLELMRLGLRQADPTHPPARVEARIRDLRYELEVWEGRRAGSQVQPSPLGLAEVQRQVVDPDCLLLEYALGEERSFLFAITRETLDVHVLEARAEIEAAALEVYEFLTDGSVWSGETTANRMKREIYRQRLDQLSTRLLGPVASRLGRQRLLIAAEGVLRYLPFGVLPDPRRPGRPILLDHEVVYLPSASVLAALRRREIRRQPAEGILAVMADPVFDAGDPRVGNEVASSPLAEADAVVRSGRDAGLVHFARLRGTSREARTIADLVPANRRFVALGFAASRERATAGELRRFRILHFATHGLLNNLHPDLSGLVFSLVDERGNPRDGFLRVHDIERLRLQADLVVLSACSTALGRHVRGEGLLGLTRGFLRAGTERVIASLWQVEDRATAELMTRFYRGLLERGMSPAAALRQAQIELYRGEAGPRFGSPYHWGAFTLQGEWRGLPDPGVARSDIVDVKAPASFETKDS